MLTKILLIAAGVMSLILFIVMGADKSAAKHGKRRVPEKTLFLLAALMGASGGILGMLAFRHKTKHTSFVVGFPLLLLLNAAVIFACWYFLK